jgi:hypothetical protein
VLLPSTHCYHLGGCDRAAVAGGGGDNTTTSSGGETDFPACGIRVTPQAGMAVLFPNVTPMGQPDGRTIHAGLPPTNNETKYGLNIWICED